MSFIKYTPTSYANLIDHVFMNSNSLESPSSLNDEENSFKRERKRRIGVSLEMEDPNLSVPVMREDGGGYKNSGGGEFLSNFCIQQGKILKVHLDMGFDNAS